MEYVGIDPIMFHFIPSLFFKSKQWNDTLFNLIPFHFIPYQQSKHSLRHFQAFSFFSSARRNFQAAYPLSFRCFGNLSLWEILHCSSTLVVKIRYHIVP
jgi:hypothetical protein